MEQYIIVAGVVAMCAVYLVRKLLLKSKQSNRSACGGCNRCGGGSCH